MIPTPEEHAVRQHVIYRIRQVISQYLPNASVRLTHRHRDAVSAENVSSRLIWRSMFTEVIWHDWIYLRGAFFSLGLTREKLHVSSLLFSDVDLIVYSADGRQWDADELVKTMSVLRDAFCQNDICTEEEIKVLNRATVPIIKLTDRQTDVKVDMSFNMNGGPRSTQLILVNRTCRTKRRSIEQSLPLSLSFQQYIEDYPYLKYLFYVLKQYLYQLDLNKVWTGGISSYSLILMIVCFFQVSLLVCRSWDFNSFSFLQVYYKKDQNAFSSSHSKSIVSPPLKHAGTIDDCSSSVSCPSSSAASCISSDEHNNCSNPSSDIDDEHSNSSRIYHPNHVPTDHVNLGHMLLSFLHLYGIHFDYAKFGIRVQRPSQPDSPAGFIAKEELFKNFSCGHRTTTNLCIVDPFNDGETTAVSLVLDHLIFSSKRHRQSVVVDTSIARGI